MKKLCSILVALCVMAFASVAFANYPTHLNGNPNYICVDGHMGTAWYVDRSSLVNQMYNPPQYILAINVVRARSAYDDEDDFYNGGKGKIVGVTTYRFFYNWNLRRMYVDRRTGANDWRYLSPNGSWAETGVAMPAGEMAFALAYNLRFYGSRAYFSDDFYAGMN